MGPRDPRRHRHRGPDPEQRYQDRLSDERPSQPLMSEHEDFVGRVRGLVVSLWGIVSSDECSEVEHLIEHDELGEARRALAWIIVEENKLVPAEALSAIEELSAGLVEKEHMPPTLHEHVRR